MRIKIDRLEIKITYKTSLKCSFYKSNGLIKEKNANLCQRHISVHGYLDLVHVQVLKETITRFPVSAHYQSAQWRSEEISLKSFFCKLRQVGNMQEAPSDLLPSPRSHPISRCVYTTKRPTQ